MVVPWRLEDLPYREDPEGSLDGHEVRSRQVGTGAVAVAGMGTVYLDQLKQPAVVRLRIAAP